MTIDGMRQITRRVDVLRARYTGRDARMNTVRAVRAGDLHDTLFGDLFPRDWPKPLVANMVDTAARDLAEVIAPLPTFSCSGTGMVDESKRTKADKRTRLVNTYMAASKLQQQMYSGADQYLTYGFLPFRVEANFDACRPHVTVEDPMGAYPEFDRWGNCTAYFRRFTKSIDELCALFPEHYDKIRKSNNGLSMEGSAMLEVIRWVDGDQEILFLPERNDLVLRAAANLLGRVPVVVARRPGYDTEIRGQFDDVLWVQLARAKFALLSMDAAQKSVEAPLAIPQDVQHLPIGGDSVIRSREPEKIRRVGIDMPTAAFAQSQQLEQEMRVGARYPEGRSGNMDASIITGRGVQALMGGFDTQVKTAQDILGDALAEVAGMCLELDEKLWPTKERTVTGTENGAPYEIKYRPDKDIKGQYAVDVAYGLMAGLDPNRALVWGLQARGDKLISRSFLRRNLPVSMNATDEERVIDIEEYRDALGQGVQAMAAGIGAMAQQGQDPFQALTQLAGVIDARKKGKPVEDAVLEAFKPPEQQATATDGQVPPGTESGVPAAGGGSSDGLMPGVAPGQAGMGPGGRPALSQLMASLGSNGKPNLSASVQRRQPI